MMGFMVVLMAFHTFHLGWFLHFIVRVRNLIDNIPFCFKCVIGKVAREFGVFSESLNEAFRISAVLTGRGLATG